MGKLKSALGVHQHKAAAAAAAKAREAAKTAKTTKSVGEKRTAKRQRREREERERERLEAGRKMAAAKGKGKERADAGDGDGDEEMADNGDEARSADKIAARAAASAGRATIPFASDDTILLLGEANFSFAVSLLDRGHAGHLMCATAFDSEAECVDKYPDAAANISRLRGAGARVGFEVDAGALEKSAARVVGRGPRFSRVVFNFPHVGKGIQDQDRNVRANQEMLLRTLRSVAPLLTQGPSAFPLVEIKRGKRVIKVPKAQVKSKAKTAARTAAEIVTDDEDELAQEGIEFDDDMTPGSAIAAAPANFTPPIREGSLLITLLDQTPYSLWDLKALATRPPPMCPGTKLAQPKYRLLRSFEFVPAAYPGYAHRRTIGWREGKSFANNEEILGRKGKARTWEFAVREEEDD